MAEDIRYYRLGLFFMISVGLVVTGIIYLGFMDYFRSTLAVETYFSNQSVRGLEVGAPVKILGVTTGRVVDIGTAGLIYRRNEIIEALKVGDLKSLADDEFQRALVVRMEILPKKGLQDFGELKPDLIRAMVELGLRARLSQSGIAGPVFIDFEYVDPEIYPVPELPWEPENLYIPSAPGILSELTAAATSILGRVRKADLTRAFDKLDQSFRALVEFSEETSIAEFRDDMVLLAEDLQTASRRLSNLLSDPRLESALVSLAETASTSTALLKEHQGDLSSTLRAVTRTWLSSLRTCAELRRMLR
jgi:paraquat-inducible protein B